MDKPASLADLALGLFGSVIMAGKVATWEAARPSAKERERVFIVLVLNRQYEWEKKESTGVDNEGRDTLYRTGQCVHTQTERLTSTELDQGSSAGWWRRVQSSQIMSLKVRGPWRYQKYRPQHHDVNTPYFYNPAYMDAKADGQSWRASYDHRQCPAKRICRKPVPN